MRPSKSNSYICRGQVGRWRSIRQTLTGQGKLCSAPQVGDDRRERIFYAATELAFVVFLVLQGRILTRRCVGISAANALNSPLAAWSHAVTSSRKPRARAVMAPFLSCHWQYIPAHPHSHVGRRLPDGRTTFPRGSAFDVRGEVSPPPKLSAETGKSRLRVSSSANPGYGVLK